MRLVPLLLWVATASVAEAAARDGAVAVGAAGNPLTPWLALAFVAMVATLCAPLARRARAAPVIRLRDETGRWSVPLLALVLYPLATGAAAVNLFFLALLGRSLGGPDLSPVAACGWGGLLGVPVAFWFARWIRGLMDEADAGG